MTPILWSLVYSPWSEQARWALEAAGVEYRRRSYRPLIDEPALRWATRRVRGPVSVPILETDRGVLDDSYRIAQYADEHAATGREIIGTQHGAVDRYVELARHAMAAGRALGLARLLDSRQALLDMVPKQLQPVLGPLAPRVAAAGIRRTLRKYKPVTPRAPRETLTDCLDTLREELDGRPHLLGELTYADMTMAQVLAFVDPPRTHLRLTDATRAVYRDGDLAERYADLLVWRDALYERDRDSSAAAS